MPIVGHATLPFSVESDGKHQFQLRIGIAKTQVSNLLGIEFCRQYSSNLQFEVPAKKLKETANAICYENCCSTKPYSFVSNVHSIRTSQQIFIHGKTSRFGKNWSEV